MDSFDWHPVLFTLWASALSVLLIFPLALLAAWVLARHEWKGKSIVETIITLPLVMPPVATGLILLQLFGRRGFIGSFLYKTFDLDIVFTWRAVVIAAGVMAFPLLVRSIRVAFEEVPIRLEQIAKTLKASNLKVFFTITLPLSRRGIIAGILLAFARALGEFGATILVAGNIPGKTQTISLSIYNLIQLGHDRDAFGFLLFSVAMAFSAVWIGEWYLRSRRKLQ